MIEPPTVSMTSARTTTVAATRAPSAHVTERLAREMMECFMFMVCICRTGTAGGKPDQETETPCNRNQRTPSGCLRAGRALANARLRGPIGAHETFRDG